MFLYLFDLWKLLNCRISTHNDGNNRHVEDVVVKDGTQPQIVTKMDLLAETDSISVTIFLQDVVQIG